MSSCAINGCPRSAVHEHRHSLCPLHHPTMSVPADKRGEQRGLEGFT